MVAKRMRVLSAVEVESEGFREVGRKGDHSRRRKREELLGVTGMVRRRSREFELRISRCVEVINAIFVPFGEERAG